MLSGATPRAEDIAGTAVFRIVVSNDSMKKATATSHGKSRLDDVARLEGDGGAIGEGDLFMLRHQNSDSAIAK
jgi:hypothetical protein